MITTRARGGSKCLPCCALLWLFLGSARAGTVAHWRFDESAGARPGSVLRDAGPSRLDLILGQGGCLVPGCFGNALRPTPPAPPAGANAPFAALRARGAPQLSRALFADVTDSRLNLGPGDWTLEGWLRLDQAARNEGVIFEIGTGPPGQNELVTRVSVLPRENAFVLTGLAPFESGPMTPSARRIEFPNPEGPPGGAAMLIAASLALDRPLPRDRWFHAALVHTADGLLHLFLDGRRSATAAAGLLALPRGAEGYLSLGADGNGQRPFAGAIDELRVSDHAVYCDDFTPPGIAPAKPRR